MGYDVYLSSVNKHMSGSEIVVGESGAPRYKVEFDSLTRTQHLFSCMRSFNLFIFHLSFNLYFLKINSENLATVSTNHTR